jgi:hypothetical protein
MKKKNRLALISPPAGIRHLRFSGLEATAGLKRFSLSELETATDHFSEENIIGRGGHSIVYKVVYIQACAWFGEFCFTLFR